MQIGWLNERLAANHRVLLVWSTHQQRNMEEFFVQRVAAGSEITAFTKWIAADAGQDQERVVQSSPLDEVIQEHFQAHVEQYDLRGIRLVCSQQFVRIRRLSQPAIRWRDERRRR